MFQIEVASHWPLEVALSYLVTENSEFSNLIFEMTTQGPIDNRIIFQFFSKNANLKDKEEFIEGFCSLTFKYSMGEIWMNLKNNASLGNIEFVGKNRELGWQKIPQIIWPKLELGPPMGDGSYSHYVHIPFGDPGKECWEFLTAPKEQLLRHGRAGLTLQSQNTMNPSDLSPYIKLAIDAANALGISRDQRLPKNQGGRLDQRQLA